MILNLSGGADSSTLLLYALKNTDDIIQPLTFNYEQKHRQETSLARFLTTHYRLKYGTRLRPVVHINIDLPPNNALTNPSINVPALDEVVGHPQPPTYVPFRNLIFTSYALSYAEALGFKKVALGVHASDIYGYWDTTPEFVLSVESLAGLNRQTHIKLFVPFLRWTKHDIIEWGLTHNLPYQYTWSCYRGGEKPCHECATCREREAAFRKCGVEDPLCVE